MHESTVDNVELRLEDGGLYEKFHSHEVMP